MENWLIFAWSRRYASYDTPRAVIEPFLHAQFFTVFFLTTECLGPKQNTNGTITTLIVAGVMYFMGGGIIQDFFFAICIGVIVGTYSSIFVAAPTVLFFDKITGKKGDAA